MRTGNFEKERQDMLERLENCAAPRKLVHELEWELKKRDDEIRELQKVQA
jgi:coiled-coil domain-containing protein 77